VPPLSQTEPAEPKEPPSGPELAGEDGSECPACGCSKVIVLFRAGDRLYATTHRVFAVVQCSSCKLMRLDPQPDPRELAGYYPRSYWFAPGETTADRLEQAYRRFVLLDHVRFVERALRNAGGSGPVLDIGCGGGLFLRLMAERGAKVVGLDLSTEAARVSWHYNGVPTIAAQLPRTPLPRESCAVVTMFHLLEHLYDPGAYLAAAYEVLEPEGRLVVQVPNAACWQFLLFGERWNGIDVPRHLFNFRKTDLDVLIRECGFEPVRWKHFSLRDNPAGLATTLLPALDPMSRRVRRVPETPQMRLTKDLLYSALVAACVPFTWVEAACGAGSTIMVEARKKR
jgi:SAM-dependent methyltransferase